MMSITSVSPAECWWQHEKNYDPLPAEYSGVLAVSKLPFIYLFMPNCRRILLWGYFFNLKTLAFKAQLVISHILTSLNFQMAFYVQNSSETGFPFFWFGLIFFFFHFTLMLWIIQNPGAYMNLLSWAHCQREDKFLNSVKLCINEEYWPCHLFLWGKWKRKIGSVILTEIFCVFLGVQKLKNGLLKNAHSVSEKQRKGLLAAPWEIIHQ